GSFTFGVHVRFAWSVARFATLPFRTLVRVERRSPMRRRFPDFEDVFMTRFTAILARVVGWINLLFVRAQQLRLRTLFGDEAFRADEAYGEQACDYGAHPPGFFHRAHGKSSGLEFR